MFLLCSKKRISCKSCVRDRSLLNLAASIVTRLQPFVSDSIIVDAALCPIKPDGLNRKHAKRLMMVGAAWKKKRRA